MGADADADCDEGGSTGELNAVAVRLISSGRDANLLRVGGVFALGASGLLHDGGCGLVERGVGQLLSKAGAIVVFLEGNALEEEGAAVQMNVNQSELPE